MTDPTPAFMEHQLFIEVFSNGNPPPYTMNKVRITHKPTGIVVHGQSMNSVFLAKEYALRDLGKKIKEQSDG